MDCRSERGGRALPRVRARRPRRRGVQRQRRADRPERVFALVVAAELGAPREASAARRARVFSVVGCHGAHEPVPARAKKAGRGRRAQARDAAGEFPGADGVDRVADHRRVRGERGRGGEGGDRRRRRRRGLGRDLRGAAEIARRERRRESAGAAREVGILRVRLASRVRGVAAIGRDVQAVRAHVHGERPDRGPVAGRPGASRRGRATRRERPRRRQRRRARDNPGRVLKTVRAAGDALDRRRRVSVRALRRHRDAEDEADGDPTPAADARVALETLRARRREETKRARRRRRFEDRIARLVPVRLAHARLLRVDRDPGAVREQADADERRRRRRGRPKKLRPLRRRRALGAGQRQRALHRVRAVAGRVVPVRRSSGHARGPDHGRDRAGVLVVLPSPADAAAVGPTLGVTS
mmetsp:Transcript_9379/g.34118  ORF Transcript_9379/g.34118 Transcript_9379/m.34118 type:complete len:413 (+) Transcript_9379:817-2055(+)